MVMTHSKAAQMAEEASLEYYIAKNVMKQAGEYLWQTLQDRIPELKQAEDKVLDGKIYAASIPPDTEMTAEVIKKLADELCVRLRVDRAFRVVMLSRPTKTVEEVHWCAGGLLRVFHWWDVTTNRHYIAFEIGAGRSPEVEVRVTMTPL